MLFLVNGAGGLVEQCIVLSSGRGNICYKLTALTRAEQMMKTIDLNIDLGEGQADDAALMVFASSCNIACGGHSGDARSMRQALQSARQAGIHIGAHPSYPDRAGFGRRSLDIDDAALGQSLDQQLMTLQRLADEAGVGISHVKPHGALYHDLADCSRRSSMFVEHVAAILPQAALIGPPEGCLREVAERLGRRYLAEGFADRRYCSDGRLVARSKAGALLETAEESALQAVSLARDSLVKALNGETVTLAIDTLCLHGDTQDAIVRAQAITDALQTAGIGIRCPL